MVGNLKSKKQEGFTIIEVLIVLAIAGLIMLIVFLAVPALQRNSRNTQRKNDAASIGTAISTFVTNNGGKLPNQVSGDGTNTNNLVVLNSASATNVEQAKLGFYETAASATGAARTADIFLTTGVVTAPTITIVASSGTKSATAVSIDSMSIYTKYKCNSDGTGIGTYSARSVAVLYVIESGSGNGNLQCLEQ